MLERGKTGAGSRRKSLLSFSREAAGFPGDAPAMPGDRARATEPDVQTAHRMARSRREARENGLLSALASAPQRRRDRMAEEPIADPEPSSTGASEPGRRGLFLDDSLAGHLRGWLRRDRASEDAPEAASSSGVASYPAFASGPRPSSALAEPYEPVSERWTPLIDPMRVIGGILDSKRLIAATTALGLLAGVGIALTTPKKYMAATEVLIDPRDLKLSDRDLTQQGLPSDATLAIVENQVRILTSGTVLGKVVDKLNLIQDDEFNGHRKSFSPGAIIAELRALLSRKGDEGNDEGREKTLAIEHLADSLSVERGGKTFVVTIAVKTQSADKSALIANTMTDVFLETYGQLQAQTVGRASDELAARLDEMRAGVEAAERKVADFKAAHDIIDPQGRPITDDEIIKLNEQLSVARAHTLELNARAASLKGANVDAVVGGALPETINSSVITELRSQYATLKSEADRLAVKLGPRHPDSLAIQAQLDGARQQLSVELNRIATSIQVELKRAVELEQQLAQRLAQLKVRQGDIGSELVQLRELERDVTTKRAVYESFLLRAKETGEQRDINTANMSVISRAYAPLSPVGPSRAMIALAGMLLGLGSGVGFAAMRGAYQALRDRRRQQRFVDRAEPPPGGPPPRRPAPADHPPGGGGASAAASSSDEAPSLRLAERAHAAHGLSTEIPADDHPDKDDAMYPRYPAAYPTAYAPLAHPGVAQPSMAHAPYPAGYAQPAETVAFAYAAPPAQAYPPSYVAAGYPLPPAAYAVAVDPAMWSAQRPAVYPLPPAYGAMPAFHGQPPAFAPPPVVQAYASQPSPWGYPPVAVPQAAAPQAFAGHAYAAQPAPRHQPEARVADASAHAIEDIRASLAECRDAINDLAETRRKRRFL